MIHRKMIKILPSEQENEEKEGETGENDDDALLHSV